MHDSKFRFWGRIDPHSRAKQPVLASAPAIGTANDGVATLHLYEPIDSWGGSWGTSAAEFMQALAVAGDVTQLRLHINSPGGEVYDAIAIVNALRAHPARVTAVVDALAASAASFIAAAADELIMQPNSELMIHDAWGIEIGPAEAMRTMAGHLDRISNNIASIYAGKVDGTDTALWRAAMLAETWYSAEEAVAAGLADEVGTPGAEPAAALNHWDLSLFRHQGRAAAPPPANPAGQPPAAIGEPGPDEDRSDDSPAAAERRAAAARHAARRHAENARRHGLAA